MIVKNLHSWNLDVSAAIALQKKLKDRISIKDSLESPVVPSTVAGVDVSFPEKNVALAVVAVLDFVSLKVLDYFYAVAEVKLPYIPGLLSFREGPAILTALEKSSPVELIFFDGHGISHPRGLGIASHIGLFVDTPTVGVAKSLLYGKSELPGETRGSRSPILSREGDLLGYSLRTKAGVKPIFVSPGNRVSSETAVQLTLKTTGKFKLPEPTRQAHNLTQRLKLQLNL